ncbi:DNA recombination protein RmuC [Candidatus Roizmanbacteria bacterium]|nr:DNA recombination protein RmuC [Candidatus Roizmanbacteria bacterium]
MGLPLFLTLCFATLVVIIVMTVIRYWIFKLEEKTKPSPELIAWLKDISQRVESSTQNVDRKLTQNIDMFNNRLDKAAFVISQVQKSIGEFSEIGRSMQELQHFLQSPKLRGNIGEQILKEILTQYLPTDCFMLQYPFKSGDKVDAVIKFSQGLIPIDSKFPLENFRKLMQADKNEEKELIRKEFERDVKKHIHDIARKYILVSEGTVDYALMYIPSEAVYYEVINNPGLFDFSGDERVLPVSPMSFYAYMKAILMSFEGQKMESQAREMLAVLRAIKKDYEKTDEALSVMNKHLTNAYNQSAQVAKNMTNLGQKLDSTALISPQSTEKLLE